MNIVLIALDTLRADRVGCYGYHRATSPNIDRLASEGVRFANTFCIGNCTQPGFTTLFTGLYTLSHGIVAHDGNNILSDDVPMLSEILQRLGYTTLAADDLVLHKPWFRRGYDDYRLSHEARSVQVNGEEVNEKALALLRQYRDKQPFFLFVHYWDPHAAYGPPERFNTFYEGEDPYDPDRHELAMWRRGAFHSGGYEGVTDPAYIEALYDGEVRYADDCVGQLMDALEGMGSRDDTVVIVLADHGEVLSESNATYLGQPVRYCHLDLYENVLRVPLIISWPPGIPKGKSFEEFAHLADVTPTVLGLIGKGEEARNMEGIDLLPVIRGEGKQTRSGVYVSEHTYQRNRAWRTDRWKLIERCDELQGTPRWELYDLRNDPGEHMNVVDALPDVAGSLREEMQAWTARVLRGRPNPFDETPLEGMGLRARQSVIARIRAGHGLTPGQ